MWLDNEETVSINYRGIQSATKNGNFVKTYSTFDLDEMTGPIHYVIQNMISKASGMVDVFLDFTCYSEEDWNYSIQGWRASTEIEKEYILEEIENNRRRAATRIDIQETREYEQYLIQFAKYGIPENTTFVIEAEPEEETENAISTPLNAIGFQDIHIDTIATLIEEMILDDGMELPEELQQILNNTNLR